MKRKRYFVRYHECIIVSVTVAIIYHYHKRLLAIWSSSNALKFMRIRFNQSQRCSLIVWSCPGSCGAIESCIWDYRPWEMPRRPHETHWKMPWTISVVHGPCEMPTWCTAVVGPHACELGPFASLRVCWAMCLVGPHVWLGRARVYAVPAWVWVVWALFWISFGPNRDTLFLTVGWHLALLYMALKTPQYLFFSLFV